MIDLFIEGGVLFMSALTIELVAMFSIAALALKDRTNNLEKLSYIKSVGTLALVTGVLGQFIGLYSAFSYISQSGQVSQAVLMQGLKVSSITSIYGLVIFIISYLLWFGISAIANK